LHGVLTPATVIPVLKQNKKIHIWVIQLELESDSERFGKIYTGTIQTVSMSELEYVVAGKLTEASEDEMANIYILYGEELPVFHAIDEEHCKDAVIYECEVISNKAKELSLNQ